MIKNVSINFHPRDSACIPLLLELTEFFSARGIAVSLPEYEIIRNENFSAHAGSTEKFLGNADLVISIGGDGTFLRTARLFSDLGKPIFGINRGRLGFLTEFGPHEYRGYLENILDGKMVITERTALEANLIKKDGHKESLCFINDAVISKGALSRAITLELEVDGQFLNSYSGDGVIISTPTGSTAYSLSAGGPIVAPTCGEVLLLTPVCPHTLAMRPMIIPVSSVLKARIISEERNLLLTIDGQEALNIDGNDLIVFNRSEKKIRVVTHPEKNFYSILREKLGWG
jgi:NAD+ kinase